MGWERRGPSIASLRDYSTNEMEEADTAVQIAVHVADLVDGWELGILYGTLPLEKAGTLCPVVVLCNVDTAVVTVCTTLKDQPALR